MDIDHSKIKRTIRKRKERTQIKKIGLTIINVTTTTTIANVKLLTTIKYIIAQSSTHL
jgi:hypothetical protein